MKEKEIQSLKNLPDNIVENAEARRIEEIARLEKERRFAEKEVESLEKKPELHIMFTKNQDLLKQYYDLRSISYCEEWGFTDFDGSENEFDRQGKIAVAVKDGKVIGGIRIMFSDSADYLSNEVVDTEYEYKKVIKRFDNRDNLLIGEGSALVVAKGHRDSSVALELFRALFEESKRGGCDYVFAVSVPSVCRRDRTTIRRLGYEVAIITDFPWKENKIYNFAKIFPMYAKFK